MENPAIIKIGGIMYIFTTPFPEGSLQGLIPPTRIFSGKVDVHMAKSNSYFAYTLILPSLLSEHYTTTKEMEAELDLALDYIWTELVLRGLANGPRPDVIDGDPSKMLP